MWALSDYILEGEQSETHGATKQGDWPLRQLMPDDIGCAQHVGASVLEGMVEAAMMYLVLHSPSACLGSFKGYQCIERCDTQ